VTVTHNERELLEHDMSDGVRVWAVDESDSLKEMEPSKLDYEERIEKWICDNVSVLVPDNSALMVIGRQVKTSSGGLIDLLCMNGDGDLVIVELKRDKTPREITAQALDYASWVQDLSAQQVEEIAAEYLKGKALEEVFEATFRDREKDYPEVINGQHSIKIVASRIDDSTERIIRYLSGKGIAINFVRFHLFKSADGKEHLVRTFIVPPEQAEANSGSGPGTKRPRRRTLQDKLNDESTDEAVREFLKQRLSDPNQELNRSNRALFYRVSGTRRFTVWVKKSHAHVIQRGRFANDEGFWHDHLSTHRVGFLEKARHLSFDLFIRDDFKFFQDTMEREIAGFRWTSAEADRDEGEENEDEEQ
jgi:predicted transcriptional regulator YheO